MTGDSLTRAMTGKNDLAARLVMGVVAGMVTAVAAATAVGFWLSYGGLHDFAAGAGMTGPEAWAWPASVDLFIVAGEAGVTVAALRHDSDWPPWLYLGLGFTVSVTGNVLHVYPGGLAWARYAVAAVPPVAAMLALAALLRQVYRLALAHEPVTVAGSSEPVTPLPVQPVTMDPELFTLPAARLAAKRGVSDSTIRRERRKARAAMASGNGRH